MSCSMSSQKSQSNAILRQRAPTHRRIWAAWCSRSFRRTRQRLDRFLLSLLQALLQIHLLAYQGLIQKNGGGVTYRVTCTATTVMLTAVAATLPTSDVSSPDTGYPRANVLSFIGAGAIGNIVMLAIAVCLMARRRALYSRREYAYVKQRCTSL